ncbi:MAG: hypothetical protein ABW252_15950 [Polyangiales bacterium]
MLPRQLARIALLLAACDADAAPHTTLPQVVLQNWDDMAGPSSAIIEIGGTYGAGCDAQSGSWSLVLDDALRNSPPHPVLAFDAADRDCALTLTSVTTADEVTHLAQGGPLLNLDVGWVAVAFGDPATLGLNIKLDHLAQEDRVRLTLVRADLGSSTVAPDARSASFPGGAQGAILPAPDYIVDLQRLSLQTDARDVVVVAQGGIALVAQSVVGTGYALVDGEPRTYAALHEAYGRAGQTISDWIPAAKLALVGVDLTTPQVRTIIIASEQRGVASYQAIAVTFSPAHARAPRRQGPSDDHHGVAREVDAHALGALLAQCLAGGAS